MTLTNGKNQDNSHATSKPRRFSPLTLVLSIVQKRRSKSSFCLARVQECNHACITSKKPLSNRDWRSTFEVPVSWMACRGIKTESSSD